MTTTTKTRKRSDLAILDSLGACTEGYDYLASHTSLSAAWRTCERGDWMAWLLWHVVEPTAWGSPERRRFAGAAAEIQISLARPFSNEHTDAAIDGVIALFTRYERGEHVTREQFVRAAEGAARAAHWPLWSAGAVRAVRAAEGAARAVDGAARAAEGAAWTAEVARADEGAEVASLSASADILRARYPKPPRLEAAK